MAAAATGSTREEANERIYIYIYIFTGVRTDIIYRYDTHELVEP